MLSIKKEGIVLEKSAIGFDSRAVLNPAVIEKDGKVHMFYRAVDANNISSIGYCTLRDGKVDFRSDKPMIIPELSYESRGIEDPRIVFFEGLYYLFYTGYDGVTARIAYAVSTDLVTFEKKGVISPEFLYEDVFKLFRSQSVKDLYLVDYFMMRERFPDPIQNLCLWDKDGMMFPRRIGGKIAFIHRIAADIQVAYADSFAEFTNAEYWRSYLQDIESHILLEGTHGYENRKVGGGVPPIETPHGWLLIYHGIYEDRGGKSYHASAALLDLEDPTKILGRLRDPLFSPEEEWEKEGDVHNVVFPTGATLSGETLTVYYGAADSRIAAASFSLSALIEKLLA